MLPHGAQVRAAACTPPVRCSTVVDAARNGGGDGGNSLRVQSDGLRMQQMRGAAASCFIRLFHTKSLERTLNAT